jgi:hypothetical protein
MRLKPMVGDSKDSGGTSPNLTRTTYMRAIQPSSCETGNRTLDSPQKNIREHKIARRGSQKILKIFNTTL